MREKASEFRCRRVQALGAAEGDAADTGCRRRDKRKKAVKTSMDKLSQCVRTISKNILDMEKK